MKTHHTKIIPVSLAAAAVLFASYLLFFHNSGGPRPPSTSTAAAGAPPGDSVQTPASYTYRIVNIFPHDPTAFTQGLAFEDGILYEGTGGAGVSTLRKVEVETGAVLQSRRVRGNYFGEGVALFGDKIIQLTYLSQTGLVYDKNSFELLERFTYPTEGWGLTHDGTWLIMSDGTANLYFLDPKTYQRHHKIEIRDSEGPVPFLNELEYIKGYVYANIWQSDDIAIIDPATGRVAGYVHLQGLIDPAAVQEPIDVLNGIAYDADNDRLFVTGKLWPELFEIETLPLD